MTAKPVETLKLVSDKTLIPSRSPSPAFKMAALLLARTGWPGQAKSGLVCGPGHSEGYVVAFEAAKVLLPRGLLQTTPLSCCLFGCALFCFLRTRLRIWVENARRLCWPQAAAAQQRSQDGKHPFSISLPFNTFLFEVVMPHTSIILSGCKLDRQFQSTIYL